MAKSQIKIAISQSSPIVGDFAGNTRRIIADLEKAEAAGADLMITPELSVCGYPPSDLAERPDIVGHCESALVALEKATAELKCAVVVGVITSNPRATGKPSQNSIVVLRGGKREFQQAKTLLPTYDVFDEARYFEPASEIRAWEGLGIRIGFAICEDLWKDDPSHRSFYEKNPVEEFCRLKPDLLISSSASPYHFEKLRGREELHARVAQKVGAPLFYVNQTGATDEVLFDGGSFYMNAQGGLQARLPIFAPAFQVFDVNLQSPASADSPAPPDPMAGLAQGLVCGIQDYFERTGFKKAVVGLSGGIDSAVVAALCQRALGAQNVLGVAMPSQNSSSHSLEDAEELSRRLQIPFEVRPIKFLYANAAREIKVGSQDLAPIALENLQSRLRGVILMTLSNHFNALVVTTGNKSEIATGYCTLYGDMCGALAPLGDVLKTQVYALAHWINQEWGAPIPQRSITKVPSAELRPNQTDQDSLPPYPLLDAFIADYIEKSLTPAELEKKYTAQLKDAGAAIRSAAELIRLIERAEFKRRQAAPVLKVTVKAFGTGRRVPIAKQWNAL